MVVLDMRELGCPWCGVDPVRRERGDVNPAVWTALGVVVAGAITGYVTWQVARRKTSGSVATTEANVLWEQARTFWDQRALTLQAELVNLRVEVVALREEIVSLRRDATEAQGEIVRLLRAQRVTEGAVAVAEGKIATLENGTPP